MSIFPAADIVSDVARAANPARAQIAISRLQKAAAMRADNGDRHQDFPGAPASRAASGLSSNQAPQRIEAGPDTPARKFEAFLLQSWLEIILPASEGGFFGNGGESSVWRSLMAEQLGDQLARSGGIGLQKMIGRDYGPTESSRS